MRTSEAETGAKAAGSHGSEPLGGPGLCVLQMRGLGESDHGLMAFSVIPSDRGPSGAGKGEGSELSSGPGTVPRVKSVPMPGRDHRASWFIPGEAQIAAVLEVNTMGSHCHWHSRTRPRPTPVSAPARGMRCLHSQGRRHRTAAGLAASAWPLSSTRGTSGRRLENTSPLRQAPAPAGC